MAQTIAYNFSMTTGKALYTKDSVWRKILDDLGLGYDADMNLDFDKMIPNRAISVVELKSIILQNIENQNAAIMNKVFGHAGPVSHAGEKIITALYHAGAAGLSAGELCKSLGYAPDSNTHAVESCVYQLRKQFGRNIIKNENGKYKIGHKGN